MNDFTQYIQSKQVCIVEDIVTLQEWVNQWVVVDVEYNKSTNKFHGVGLYNGQDTIYYVTHLTPNVIQILNHCYIIGHNFKSDWRMFNKWGITLNLKHFIYDTMTMAYNFNPRENKLGLKPLALKYLSIKWPTYKELFGTKDLSEFDINLVANYNALDCYATWKLWEYYLVKSTRQHREYFEKVEMPITKVLLQMENKGIKIDTHYLNSITPDITDKVNKMKQHLQTLVGPIQVKKKVNKTDQIVTITEFNPNSPVQKVAALNKLGIHVQGADKKKDLHFVQQEPFVRELQKYNKLKDCYTKYISALPKWIQDDGRIYPQFNQTTLTGRLSSKNPNMQNIEAHGELGKIVRRAFIPKENHVFIGADYSQIDSRVLTHLSQEPVWIKVFNNPASDLHQETANEARRVTGLEISRQVGKTINHGAGYGAGPRPISYELNCSVERASQFLNAIKRALPVLEAWKISVHANVHKRGGVSTLLGRFISLPEIYSADFKERGHAERQAVSILGQGGTAEIIKLAMINLEQHGLIPLVQEHDSLLFEIPKNEVEDASKIIQYEMEHAYELKNVPLKVDLKIGNNWAEVK